MMSDDPDGCEWVTVGEYVSSGTGLSQTVQYNTIQYSFIRSCQNAATYNNRRRAVKRLLLLMMIL